MVLGSADLSSVSALFAFYGDLRPRLVWYPFESILVDPRATGACQLKVTCCPATDLRLGLHDELGG